MNVIEEHYGVSNDFFKHFLSKDMSYTSGVWETGERTLEEAALTKYCFDSFKLEVKRGMSLLDIGCGWGSFVGWLRKKGIAAEGLNLCEEQIEYCNEHYPDSRFYHTDFYDFPTSHKYDRIFSVGVLVHQKGRQVEYFKKCLEHLNPGGIMVHWCRHANNPRQLIPHCRGLQESYRQGEFRKIENTMKDLDSLGCHSEYSKLDYHNYIRTIEHWRLNMILNEKEMRKINSDEFDRTLRTFDEHINVMKEGLLDLWCIKSYS